MAAFDKIKIEALGIAEVLHRQPLVVPVNQRDYSWEEPHVTDLFQDLQKAIDDQETSYFLGTIALTGSNIELPEVTDGQQRLATTSILLSAMRDYFFLQSDTINVDHLEQNYLRSVDPDEGEYPPRLNLNMDDRRFFRQIICTRPGDVARAAEPTRASHRLMKQAAELAAQRVQIIISGHSDSNKKKRLRAWVKFLEQQAIVIVLRMPNDMNAFRMFETLNDRGRKTTQLDILKNYLFQESGDRKNEAQPLWSKMIDTLETLEIDDIALTFVRHAVATSMGLVRAAELYDRIEKSVSGKARSIAFIDNLSQLAVDYVALLSPDHKKWNEYPSATRNHLKTMLYLRVIPIRPVLLAIAKKFSPSETEKGFRYALSVVVRFLIAGGARGEKVEESYALRSQEIMNGQITKTKQLATALAPIVPNDSDFESAFQTARVSKPYLARYYLRALELKVKGDPEPEWIPNEETVINLEHVMPENPGTNWPDIDSDLAASYWNRIGNIVPLQASKNTMVGNSKFSVKRPILKASAYILTSEVANSTAWKPADIDERQKKLAKLAVETWPLKVK